MSTDKRGFGKARRILDSRAERQRSDRTHARHRHQQSADGIGLHRRQHQAVKFVQTANCLLANRENRTNDPFEKLIAIDELAHAPLQPSCVDFANLQAERLENAVQMVVQHDPGLDQPLAAA